jgi:4-amino-4-deoxy-L-arabinose transferase-like glycosyltransferase
MSNPEDLNQESRSAWRSLMAGLAIIVTGIVPWPAALSDAVAYLGEPVGRVRLVIVLLGAMLALSAVLARRIAAVLERMGGRLSGTVLSSAGIVLIVAAAVPRLYWPVEFVKLGAPDHVEYALGAVNLLERGQYGITLGGVDHPPRYPFGYSAFFVAPVLAVTELEPRHAVYASFVCALGVVLLVWHLARRYFSEATAAASVGVLLLFPLFVKYATEVFAEQAVVLLVLAVLALTLRWMPRSAASVQGKAILWQPVVLGVLIGSAAAVKFSLGLLVLVALAWTVTGKRIQRWAGAGVLLLGFAAGLAPLLMYNAARFGSPLRSGYHYWCSIPYDFPSLVFSAEYLVRPVRGNGPGNLMHYLVPAGEAPQFRAVELAFEVAFWTLAAAGTALAWRRRGEMQGWNYSGIALLAGVLFFAFYGVYFFQDARFLLPVYVALVPVVVWGAERLLHSPPALVKSRCFGILLLAGVCGVTWGLGPRWSRASQEWPRKLRRARNTLVDWCETGLPQDALVISNLDGAFVEYYLLRGTQRSFLPLDRGVEYASKYVQPRAPGNVLGLPTEDPFGHRETRLPGAVEVYPKTALEVLEELATQAKAGATFYLLLEVPYSAASVRRLAATMRMREVARWPESGRARLWVVWRIGGRVMSDE